MAYDKSQLFRNFLVPCTIVQGDKPGDLWLIFGDSDTCFATRLLG